MEMRREGTGREHGDKSLFVFVLFLSLFLVFEYYYFAPVLSSLC